MADEEDLLYADNNQTELTELEIIRKIKIFLCGFAISLSGICVRYYYSNRSGSPGSPTFSERFVDVRKQYLLEWPSKN